MPDTAKAHHLVSKFYLRYFADGGGQVMTVRLPGDKTFPQSIERASVHNNYYLAVGRDGELTDVAEASFNEIEGPAAEVWRQVDAGIWPLPEAERSYLAAWVALHLLRGDQTRRAISDIGTDGLQLAVATGGRRQLRETLRETGQPYDDDSVDDAWIDLFRDPLEVVANANQHLEHVARMLPRVMASLLSRWWLQTTFQHKGLATSDQPVFIVPNESHAAVGKGTGIENAEVIHAPLTRRRSLAMYARGALPPELAGVREDRQIAGVAATALYSNSCTVNSAWRTLFHHPDDTPLKGLTLHPPRSRQIGLADGDLWKFMPPEDRQVLIDAGVTPPVGSRTDDG